MKKSTDIIFIGGTGRCGTNILKNILSKHSEVISLPFEYRFIIDPGGLIDFLNSFAVTWSPFIADYKIRKLERFLLSLAENNFFTGIFSALIKKLDYKGTKIAPQKYYGWELKKWIPNYKNNVKTLIDELKTFEFNGCWPGTPDYSIKNNIYFSEQKKRAELVKILSNFINNCIENILAKHNKKYFVEDNTWNILFAKELFELIPNAKLIHINRDPRDVIASFREQRWCPSNLDQTILWYKSIIMKWMEIKKNLQTKDYIEIKLEELISQPEDLLKQVCNLIGINFEKNLLQVNLNSANINRWKKDFPKKEQEYLENNLHEIITSLKYSV